MSDLHCTFCCKHENDVAVMISAKDAPVYICDECVDLCNYIILRRKYEGLVIENKESKG